MFLRGRAHAADRAADRPIWDDLVWIWWLVMGQYRQDNAAGSSAQRAALDQPLSRRSGLRSTCLQRALRSGRFHYILCGVVLHPLSFVTESDLMVGAQSRRARPRWAVTRTRRCARR